MSITIQEKKYAKKMKNIAEKEALKLGLKPYRFVGAFTDESFHFEIQFRGTLQ